MVTLLLWHFNVQHLRRYLHKIVRSKSEKNAFFVQNKIIKPILVDIDFICLCNLKMKVNSTNTNDPLYFH